MINYRKKRRPHEHLASIRAQQSATYEQCMHHICINSRMLLHISVVYICTGATLNTSSNQKKEKRKKTSKQEMKPSTIAAVAGDKEDCQLDCMHKLL